ncbi:MAG: alpha/beta fold hydrolase [Candidatus Binataceae bacterium]
MPIFQHGDVKLNYEEYGSGYPLLVIAPGGMRSEIDFWHRSPFDPTKELATSFRVIAMDQRNAGLSRAPVSASDSWESFAADQLALLDHLKIRQCHIMGGCIGSSYCLALIKAAPARVSAAILQNPIGLGPDGIARFHNMFDDWAAEFRQRRPEVSEATLVAFRANMFSGDFVFAVTRDFVRSCMTPMLILAGNDPYHPTAVSKEIAMLAPNAEIILEWKTPDTVGAAVERVRAYLKDREP